MSAKRIDTGAITHIYYAFTMITQDYGVTIDDNVNDQFQHLRELGSSEENCIVRWLGFQHRT